MAAVTQKKRFAPLLFVVGVAVFLLGWPATSWPTSWQQRPQASASPAIAIDHVALHVADLDASVAFYSGVFGLQEIPAAAKGRRWLSLGKGVALHPLGGRSEPVADDRSVHVALTSDNHEPILERLRERRIAWSDFAGAPGAVSTGRSDGVRQIFLRDPDGYWIEVNDALKKTTGDAP
jgi:catechol 2,3-dioxygenase-like lactoylglutathione lyase family enzyme